MADLAVELDNPYAGVLGVRQAVKVEQGEGAVLQSLKEEEEDVKPVIPKMENDPDPSNSREVTAVSVEGESPAPLSSSASPFVKKEEDDEPLPYTVRNRDPRAPSAAVKFDETGSLIHNVLGRNAVNYKDTFAPSEEEYEEQWRMHPQILESRPCPSRLREINFYLTSSWSSLDVDNEETR
ncbi:hypothetical protein JCM8547_001679 [Rhodosporidiobolus lusitaniae]